MALFLESGISTQFSAKYNGLSLTECLCEGINLTQEMMELQEAVFKADFILHSRNQGLSESVQVLNEAGFLSSVWEKTKAMVKRVWDWIKATWNKLIAKVTEWANRIGDRLAGKTKEVKKSTIKRNELMETLVSKMIDLVISAADKVSASKDNETIKDLQEKLTEMKDDAKEKFTEADRLEGRVTVSATFAKKVADSAKRVEKAVTKAISNLNKLEATITKETMALKGDDNENMAKKDDTTKTMTTDSTDRNDGNAVANANHKIAFIRQATSFLSTATSDAGTTFSQAVTALSGGEKGNVEYKEAE